MVKGLAEVGRRSDGIERITERGAELFLKTHEMLRKLIAAEPGSVALFSIAGRSLLLLRRRNAV
jgi:hypothetical protein